MEWSEVHDLILAKEVRLSEPWNYKARTVDRGKVWTVIADRLNKVNTVKFSVTKKSVREHFNLLLEKFKVKRRNQAKLSGVNVEDSELDVLMEEISEKWEEAETKDGCFTDKQKAEADRAAGEEIRQRACEQLGETKKRKVETESNPGPKKARRSGSETLHFLKEKMAVRQAESDRQSKVQEEMLAAQREQQKLYNNMLGMMQNQNTAILQLLSKMSDKMDK